MNSSFIIILYIRISVEDIDNHENGKDESNSVSNQREMLRAFVDSQPEFADCQTIELCDDGYSGTNLNRPAVTEMLSMVKKGQANCIIVKDFSRFGRDYLTVSDYVDQIFPFMGIRFISINDHYDSAKCKGATSGVDIAFRNVIYGYYSQDLSIKVKSGKQTKAENGDFLSPFAPIGYQKSPTDKNQLIIEPEGAKIVRRIFQMFGEGKTVLQLTRQLNAEGVPTASELQNRRGFHHKWWESVSDRKLWDTGTVTNILRDERYLGKNIYGKRPRLEVGNPKTRIVNQSEWIIREDCHEPIITEAEFVTARDKLKEYIAIGNIRCGEHLFSGKLRCGNCGYSLCRVKKPKPHYICTTHYKLDDCSCMKGQIKESELADIVLSAVHAYVSSMLDEKALLKKAESNGKIPRLQKQLSTLQGSIESMKERKAQLYDLLAEQKITRDAFKKKQEQLSKQQENAQHQFSSAQKELAELERILYSNQMQENQLESYLNVNSLTREMVKALIDCIYVFDDKSVHIQWRFGQQNDE